MFKQSLIVVALGVRTTGALVNGFEMADVPAPSHLAERETKTHEGKVVSTAEGKLVMSDGKGGNEQTFTVPPAAIISLDGKSAKLNELMKGDSVKVTTGTEGNVTAVVGQRAKS
ncbi:MAG: hypothetical protein AABP62_26085 [Planctomycetota bacterium]